MEFSGVKIEIPAFNAVLQERMKQIHSGLDAKADDWRTQGQLAILAAAYALRASRQFDEKELAPTLLKIPNEYFDPADTDRENLVTAASYLIAEIERLDRLEVKNAVIEQIARAIAEQPEGHLHKKWQHKAEAAYAVLESLGRLP